MVRFVEQQFFLDLDRTEIIVDVTERANALDRQDQRRISPRFERMLARMTTRFWTSYVRRGAPRSCCRWMC